MGGEEGKREGGGREEGGAGSGEGGGGAAAHETRSGFAFGQLSIACASKAAKTRAAPSASPAFAYAESVALKAAASGTTDGDSSMRWSHLAAAAGSEARANALMTAVNECTSAVHEAPSSIVVSTASACDGLAAWARYVITVLKLTTSGLGRASSVVFIIADSSDIAFAWSPIARYALSCMLHASASSRTPLSAIRRIHEITTSGGLERLIAPSTLLWSAAVGSRPCAVHRCSIRTAAVSASVPSSSSAESTRLTIRVFTAPRSAPSKSSRTRRWSARAATICASTPVNSPASVLCWHILRPSRGQFADLNSRKARIFWLSHLFLRRSSSRCGLKVGHVIVGQSNQRGRERQQQRHSLRSALRSEPL